MHLCRRCCCLQVQHKYLLSSGAQNALSPSGVFFRQNYGDEYEIAVSLKSRLWSVKFYLAVGSWTHVTLTYKSDLTVYVDGLLVGSDQTGSPRLYSATQFNQFANIVIGSANDVKFPTTIKGGVAIWRMMHADSVYSISKVAALVGEYSDLGVQTL